jgi:DNA-binding Lrp family transcriptional regulator
MAEEDPPARPERELSAAKEDGPARKGLELSAVQEGRATQTGRESSTATEDHATQMGRELSTAVVMFHEAVGAYLGVSAGDQRALTLIGRDGPMSAGELAEKTGLTPGAVTGMIDRLERAGLARREHDAADRRRVLVTATGGRPDVFGGLAAAMATMTSRYSEAELQVIADYVTRTVDILRAETRKLSESLRARRR